MVHVEIVIGSQVLMLTQSVYYDRFECIIIQFVTAHIFFCRK